ncbi:ATP-dependent Clp protease proteolytic subunit [Verrucomicrobium spinosum]|uniref:ATP-dependent Clp protease proteolytic subunit n=1 Tax=Verrucomicrobium spinosum TaxID=2736 RepID=UPI0012F6D86A|nr:ATP-dependent Clp protease proteolytic subunit [Verrucomicrobium spinosum]
MHTTIRLAALLLLVIAGSSARAEALNAGLPAEDLLELQAQQCEEKTTAPAPSLDALKAEVGRLTVEKEKLSTELALAQAAVEKELSPSKLNTLRLQAQLAELKAKQDLAEYQEKLAEEKALEEDKRTLDRALLKSSIAKAEVETELAEIRRIENATQKEIARINSGIALEKEEEEARNYAMSDPVYLTEPLQGRKLVMSDRRIALNGPISMRTADNVIARINYFNNRDAKLPIFLVIDDSPGGSVMAGYKIVKAMQGSQAPVHVVVKSFAASMAACIATVAKHSYAYSNTVILHHQIHSFAGGNLTQQQEWLKEMEEWWRRLADPVAVKMGISREELIKQMYAHASSGDWSEFGDNAQKLKWVDHIVDEIQETGTIKSPDVAPKAPGSGSVSADDGMEASAHGSGPVAELKAQVDEKGRPYMSLPRLNPRDCYWLYNPDGYFRAP